jgi:hypothetical protein
VPRGHPLEAKSVLQRAVRKRLAAAIFPSMAEKVAPSNAKTQELDTRHWNLLGDEEALALTNRLVSVASE